VAKIGLQMLQISKDELGKIKNNFSEKRIAVVGDMMLDCYFWGDVKRISPEAPVPVVEVDNEFYRFGGAANCAYNIIKLGGVPFPIGVIGNDNDGREFNSLMSEAEINSEGIIIDEQRPTTAKTRVIADNHHIVRIDRETKQNISEDTENKIIDYFNSKSDSLDAVILQDYNKGVLTKRVIKEVIEIANSKNIIITVDPKFDNFFEFTNVTVFKPNKKETEDAFGIRIENDEEIINAGKKLLEKLNPKYALLTLGEAGVALFQNSNDIKRISTKARKVRDVSGAGDTVISTLTMALAAKADISTSAYLANYAAGIVCEEVGIVPIELNKLFDTVNSVIK
jgi:rfaE bifunctional protein kinase chain/domain